MERIRNIIDLHCDTLTKCEKRGFHLTNESLQLSLCKLPENIRLCQAMAVFIPDELRGYDAERYFDRVYEYFLAETKKYNIEQLFDESKIYEALLSKRFAAMLTVEGGAVLNGKLENVKRIYDLGVRMMTLTWNAANEICGGVETTQGFTAFGRKVVAEMERLGMVLDVSHLSDAGFFELCGLASKPFAASHSNSRKICKHPRNLTDGMFVQIANRGGIVGLNYCKRFIRDDGENGTVADLIRHAHHFLELGGEDTLALGSDFDGTDVPDYISGVEKLGFLAEAFEKSGISRAVTDKILFINAAKFFGNLAGGKKL